MIKFSFSSSKETDEETRAADELLQTVAALTEKVNSLEKKVATLETAVADLQQAAASQAEAAEAEAVAADSEPAADAAPTVGHFYLAAPTPDGLFTDISTTEQTGKSIYLLSTDDGQTGFFSLIDSDEAMATAMISLSQFVKTACKVVGSTNRPSRHVVNVEEGTVTRENDAWRIVRKAVVRFE